MQQTQPRFPALSAEDAATAQQWALNIHLARMGMIKSAIAPRAGNRRQRPPAEDKLARKRRKASKASRKRNRAR